MEKEGKLPLLSNKLVKGQTTVYICQDRVCKQPVTSVEKGFDMVKF